MPVVSDRHPLFGPSGSARPAGEPGALAIVRGDEPRVFLAEDAEVLSRLLGWELVARTTPAAFTDAALLARVREALLQERWGDALVAWMEATGCAVDVYEGWHKVWRADELDTERAAMEIRMAPIFGQGEERN